MGIERIQEILQLYIPAIKEIYGDNLKKIILYGSYARGEATLDSDIDIMVLVDLDDMEIKKYSEIFSGITYDINYDYDVMIMPMVKNAKHFYYWVDAYPFYNNVNREGIVLYESI